MNVRSLAPLSPAPPTLLEGVIDSTLRADAAGRWGWSARVSLPLRAAGDDTHVAWTTLVVFAPGEDTEARARAEARVRAELLPRLLWSLQQVESLLLPFQRDILLGIAGRSDRACIACYFLACTWWARALTAYLAAMNMDVFMLPRDPLVEISLED